jgi:putative colanic acid biosynthesis UDP-glucose lipid carrier transferase
MKKTFIIDFLIVFFSFIIGYFFRFYIKIFPEKGIPPISPYIKIAFFSGITWVLVFSFIDFYKEKIFVSFVEEFSEIIKGCLISIFIIMSGSFLYRGFSYSRLSISFSFLFSFIFLWVYHYILSKRKKILKNIIILGEGKNIEKLSKRLTLSGNVENIIFLKETEKFDEIIDKLEPDCIISGLKEYEKNLKLYKICDEKNVKLYLLPELQLTFFSSKTENFEGIPLFSILKTPAEKLYSLLMKRCLDLIFGIPILIIFCFLFPILFVLIKIDSKGPVFFKQERIGYKGKKFFIYKFRTMKYPYNFNPPFTLPDDARITRVGRFLRNYNIDEFPQIINVLKGEMSLVGPRPISVDDKYFFDFPEFEIRNRVKPGMTGLSQIYGLTGSHKEPEERFQYELYYIENWSIFLDISILLLTLFAIGKRKI